MKNRIIIIMFLFFLFSSCYILADDPIKLINPNLGISKLTDNIFLVQSSFNNNGRLDCDHLLVVDKPEIVLINTPVNDSLTVVYLNWIELNYKQTATKLIVTHSHVDCAGGINETKRRGIISYSLDKTKDLLKVLGKDVNHTFSDSLTLNLPSVNIKLWYPGAGHTVDNIVVWFPKQKILYGGCLVKALSVNYKGNTRDSDLKAWPLTIQKLKEKYGDIPIIVPGHEEIGDIRILDHTIEVVTQK
jgi:metallo-beta-lactamase class B